MKTVIWDFNGTIIDDAWLCLAIENKMLKDRGMKQPYSMDEYLDLFGFPVIDYYRKLGYTFENESYEVIADEFHQRYDAGFKNVGFVQGFQELLEQSIAKGYRNVILSASRTDKLKQQCELLGIYTFFDEILGIDNLFAGSKVEMAKQWMKESGIDSNDCMYIGDTEHDLQTATSIGVKECYLVACGHQSYEVLKKTGAKHVVRQLKEVSL